jgi:2-keto-4-pentenoate hydratase/2-oxohepta-3-ene-1,7-dioic acid hydratase in catechol pathway
VRLATILEDGAARVGLLDGDRVLPLVMPGPDLRSMRGIAGAGAPALEEIWRWAGERSGAAWRPIADVALGPAVPDPGAIYTVGLNYRAEDEGPGTGPERPLIYGKAPTSVVGHGAVVAWDRSLTTNVDAECELGLVIGETAWDVTPDDAMRHVFGYTVINDVSSRDPWLDGDQWLLGKSMPGFCPVGPWVVTANEIDPTDLRLGCTVNGVPIQDARTSRMRFTVAGVISYLSRHVVLRPGDLVATGTPARLTGPMGPDRHLRAGDVVTTWIERLGELAITIA